MRILLTSFAKKTDALKFAQRLLKDKLAACCSVIPGAVSLYRWKSRQVKAREYLLLIKTTAAKIKKVEQFIKKSHSYELPECLSWQAEASKEFGLWMQNAVK